MFFVFSQNTRVTDGQNYDPKTALAKLLRAVKNNRLAAVNEHLNPLEQTI